MFTDELQKIIDEYNKLSQEKTDYKIVLETSQINVDLLEKELEEVKMLLNSIRKSPNHTSVRSNRSILNVSHKSSFHYAENSINITCFTCSDVDHKSF